MFMIRYDSDGGGSLDSSELKKVVRGLMKVGRKDLSDQELSAFVNNLDEDGSGSLEFNEILAFVQPSKVCSQPYKYEIMESELNI